MHKLHVKNYIKKYGYGVGIFIVGIVATSLAIYLTPLHDINLVAPSMHEIDPLTLNRALQQNPGKYMIIDVRTQAQYDAGHVPGSINVSIPNIYSNKTIFPRSDKTIVLVCGDGRSAAVAYGYLARYGFHNLLHATGGFNNWKSQNLPAEITK